MNAQQFLDEFRHIANAPGGIGKLRQMIYQLAVTGSLTPRGEEAEDAGQLLSEIEQARRRLIAAKKYKRMVELETELLKQPRDIAIPKNWRWSRLLDIGEINPRNNAPDDLLVAFVPMSGVPQSHKAPILAELKRWSEVKKGYTHFANGDVVLAKITPCFENGKASAVECLPGEAGIGAGTTELQVFRPIHEGVLPNYVYLFLRSPLFTVEGQKNMTGTAGQKRLPTDYFATRAFPLPPTEEQFRIVAKVDELMALCDQLEAQQQDRRKLQNVLRNSILQALANAQSPHELQDSWQRLQTNVGRIFSEPEDVKELRQALMELAIRGLLTKQLKSDGDAAELVFPNSAANTSSPRGRRKAVRPREVVSESDAPFALPRNWIWARLSDVGYFLGGGTPSKSNPDYWRGPIPWVSPKDMKVARISSSQDNISEEALSESAARLIPTGSLLVVVRGMILAHSFPVALTSREVAINQDMKALCPHRKEIGEFLLLLLDGSKRRFLELVERSTHGTCRLETDRFASCVVGIPPLLEQTRILETINKLMLICDALQSQLGEVRQCSASLAIAASASLTGISLEQEEGPLKAPQTELIAVLRLGTPPDVQGHAPLATILARGNGELSARDLWQRFGGEIDAFYAQLKTEVAHGWIAEPAVAEVREKLAEPTGA
ncbi:restriction endonuclease subunit S [Bradyrhizobium diazoefficiens]|nr:restriction endonuclease subunit S [Bradyrhizobium diazoefficiens]MBR0704569.1 restriction endonuclease subunit S [Bradyrhizobium diazoefficiens]MBR0773137.1 restriction endonuclease subunit S [Bradyrhizobium diazoefficiens]